MTRVAGLGVVPDAWQVLPARRVLTRVKRDDQPDLGIVTAFRDGQVTLRSKRRMDGFTEADKSIGYQTVHPGDLAVHSMDGFAGAIGVSDSVGRMSPVVHLYQANQGDERYVAYLLRTVAAAGWIGALAKGIRERSTSFDPATLADLAIPYPLLPEQRRIADFLDDQVTRIDQAIQLRKRQVELLREQQISTIRFETTRGNGATRPTGIAWMPEVNESWPLVRVGAAFTTGSGSTPPSDDLAFYDGGIPWLLTGDLNDGIVTQTKRTISEEAISRFGTLRAYPAGSLVIAMYGATIGRLGRLGIPASVNQACCVLTNETTIDTSFAFYWFLGQRSEIVNLGTGGGQPNISQELVRSLRIPVPGEHEQHSIITRLDQITGSASLLLQRQSDAMALLEERKRSLITAAVTGEFDVSSASVRASGVATGVPGDQ